jgi:hypothetical protein
MTKFYREGAVMNLTTMTQNALNNYFDRPIGAEIDPQEVASLNKRSINHISGLGKKGIADLEMELEALGFNMSHWSLRTKPTVCQSTINKAIELLERHGFVVEKRSK